MTNLEVEARAFADRISDLLNGTVCNGVHLTSVAAEAGRVVVGHGISRNDTRVRRGISLSLSKKAPSAYLGVQYRLMLDEEGDYLTVQSSYMGLFRDQDLNELIAHNDYERDKEHGYPEAHLQVGGECAAWDALSQARGLTGRPLHKLHFPVGDRRYRPTLEDLLAFLIAERLVDARSGAMELVEAGRADFRRRQLRAAVRRDPDTAREILREMGQA